MCEGCRARGEAGRGNDARSPDFGTFEEPGSRRGTRDSHEAGDDGSGRGDAFHCWNPAGLVARHSRFDVVGSGNHAGSGNRRTDPVNLAGPGDDRADPGRSDDGSDNPAGVWVVP